MLPEEQLESVLRDLIIDICEVMYHRGYDMICVGHIMRLVGVNDDRASKHDQEFFALDQSFEKLLKEAKKTGPVARSAHRHTPPNVTLH